MADSSEVVVDWFACCNRENYAKKFVKSGIDSIKKLRNLEKDQLRKIESVGWLDEKFRMLQGRTSTGEELSQEVSNISLFAACKRGQLNRVEMLMENGRADKNWHSPYDYMERTPLMIASDGGHTAVVELLVDRGAHVNDTDGENYTALHWCVMNGHDDISRYLIKHNANVNAVTELTQTPAHYAAQYGHLNVLKVLHQHGADLSLRDYLNHTPLDVSRQKNHTAVTAYLESVANEPTLSQPSPSPSPPPSPPSPSHQPSAQPSSTIDRVEVSSPPTGVAGSPHSQATQGSPVSSSMSSTAATPLTTSQYNKGDTPTLLEIMTMKGADGRPLRIVETIASSDYKKFGMFLLQDENGAAVDILKKNHISEGAEAVTQSIIKEWLTSGAPTHSYQHLIECLRQSELGALAEEIATNTTGMSNFTRQEHLPMFSQCCQSSLGKPLSIDSHSKHASTKRKASGDGGGSEAKLSKKA